MCSSIDSSRGPCRGALGSSDVVPISQQTTLTPSMTGIIVTNRSGSATAASAPAASIAALRAGSREVPRTAWPSAASARASDWPRQPQPTMRTRAITRSYRDPPVWHVGSRGTRKVRKSMSRHPRHPGLHDARGAELPHRLLDVRGVPTFLYDAGEGPPVVLIHGYGDTADGWRRVVPGLLRV